MTDDPWRRFIGSVPNRELVITLPADSHERYAPNAARKLLGTTLMIRVGVEGKDEKTYPFLVLAAEVSDEGRVLRLTIKPVEPYEPPPDPSPVP